MAPDPNSGRVRTVDTERLVLSHFSLARDHPLDDRISAAASAGFAGIGLFAGQYRQLLADGWSANRVHELLDEGDIGVIEVEALSGWGAATPTDDYLAFEQLVWDVVDEFGATYVQSIGPVEGPPDAVAARFAALCDRAADHGASVGLEFLPFTNVIDAGAALSIVERADRSNSGVCVDIWHHVRGANDLDLIRAIPTELIAGIQMSDGPIVPVLDDYKDDCIRHRVPPGHGSFDVDGFVAAMLAKGVDRAWDLEVCSAAAWGQSASSHATACAEAMRTVLRRHLD